MARNVGQNDLLVFDPDVPVRAADAGGGDVEDDATGRTGGVRHLADLGQDTDLVEDHGAHGVRAGPVGHRRRTQALTPNTQASSVIETSVTSTMPMRFSHSPPLTMSPMRTYPEP